MRVNNPKGKVARSGWRLIRFARARPWLVVATGLFVVVAGALAADGIKSTSALLLSFDVGALFYLVMLARLFIRTPATSMTVIARKQDIGRRGTLWAAVAVSTVVLVALSTELHASKGGGPTAIAMAAVTIVLSWLFMNTIYALHYAHGYYGDFGKQHKGLDFPGNEPPDYWDFVYFAFVIGMCFQVSDVQISSKTLRRTALLHSVIGFFFNVFIIALSVNIAAGAA